MSTNNDGWILMSERQPTQFPVWCYNATPDDNVPLWLWPEGRTYDYCPRATHWKPAAADIPAPPREKTQAEKDEQALRQWCAEHNFTPLFTERKYWHAALAYERAEVAKLLTYSDSELAGTVHALNAIRARCGGGK